MHTRHHGQSIVEMALVLPILFFVIFGIIDMGYYVYGYSTLYQAARNGAREASMLPPQVQRVLSKSTTVDRNDNCVANVLAQVSEDATLFPDLVPTDPVAGSPYVQIRYPGTSASTAQADYQTYRQVGQPIEVTISYPVTGLTPLSRLVLIGTNGRITVNVTARRSIESLGSNPNTPNMSACN